MIRTKITILSTFILLFSCAPAGKIESLKPEPDDALPLTYESSFSYIHLPVAIRFGEIENQVNKYMTGLIYDDKSFEDDDITMQIWKQAPIQIINEKGKIKTILPLKTNIKYRIGTDKLGMNLYNTREFNLNGTMHLLSDVAFTNWKLKTSTQLVDLKWNESPTTVVLGKQIPITYLINPTIKLFRSDIEKSIDEAIEKSMDFKPNVLAALETLSQPFEMSNDYQSWLRLTPVELYSTQAQIQKENVNLEMGLKCIMETMVGQKPASKFNRETIVLKPVSKMPKNLSANIVAVSTYQDASRIMTQNFKGVEFGSGKRKVAVQNVGIWHKSGKMVIALVMTGSVNGTIYLTGFPQYNDQTKEIFFDQLDYTLDTKSTLARTANWLAEGMILRKIRENCRYSIKTNLDEGKANMQQYLNNYSPMTGVFVNGVMNDIQFQKVQLTNKAIIATIKVTGDINVKVDGLK